MLEDIKKTAEQKMQKSLESLKNDLAKIRTGRAHVGLLDHVMVEYYGSMVAVNQVANVNLGDSRTINVQPYEKNMIGMLTEERRRDLTKIVRTEGEGAKVAIRNVRRDANDTLKKLIKDKEISEDDERRAQDDIQKATDKAVADVDKMLQVKETDLMAV